MAFSIIRLIICSSFHFWYKYLQSYMYVNHKFLYISSTYPRHPRATKAASTICFLGLRSSRVAFGLISFLFFLTSEIINGSEEEKKKMVRLSMNVQYVDLIHAKFHLLLYQVTLNFLNNDEKLQLQYD